MNQPTIKEVMTLMASTLKLPFGQKKDLLDKPCHWGDGAFSTSNSISESDVEFGFFFWDSFSHFFNRFYSACLLDGHSDDYKISVEEDLKGHLRFVCKSGNQKSA